MVKAQRTLLLPRNGSSMMFLCLLDPLEKKCFELLFGVQHPPESVHEGQFDYKFGAVF